MRLTFRRRVVALGLAAAAALALSGCANTFWGNGQIPSSAFFSMKHNSFPSNLLGRTMPSGSPLIGGFQFYYRVQDPTTGRGIMVGNYFDNSPWSSLGGIGFTKNKSGIVVCIIKPKSTSPTNTSGVGVGCGSNEPLQLSFNNAPGDICYGLGVPPADIAPGEISCNGLAQYYCSNAPTAQIQQECLAEYNAATGNCMETVFNYDNTNKDLLNIFGDTPFNSGQGFLLACDGSQPGISNVLTGGTFNQGHSFMLMVIPCAGITNGSDWNGPYSGYMNFGPLTSGVLHVLN